MAYHADCPLTACEAGVEISKAFNKQIKSADLLNLSQISLHITSILFIMNPLPLLSLKMAIFWATSNTIYKLENMLYLLGTSNLRI